MVAEVRRVWELVGTSFRSSGKLCGQTPDRLGLAVFGSSCGSVRNVDRILGVAQTLSLFSARGAWLKGNCPVGERRPRGRRRTASTSARTGCTRAAASWPSVQLTRGQIVDQARRLRQLNRARGRALLSTGSSLVRRRSRFCCRLHSRINPIYFYPPARRKGSSGTVCAGVASC